MTAGRTSAYGELYVLGFEPVEDSVFLHERNSAPCELLEYHLVLGPDDVDQTIEQLYKQTSRTVTWSQIANMIQ